MNYFLELLKEKELKATPQRISVLRELSKKNHPNIDDLYAAIDLATSRAQKAMRRMHDRETEHHKDGLNTAKSEASSHIDIKEAGEALEDKIVPVELELYKPREVEDVLQDLKESGKLFDIFIDHEGKTRVLYKRNDGRFGLY